VALETGKTYTWCSCGLSKTEPFCDGTHKLDGITNVRPVRFQVEKSGEYYMCNCKQTSTRPICDGNHKEVSAAPRDFNATRFVMFGDNSPVYDGVARKLGYKPKNGGFQALRAHFLYKMLVFCPFCGSMLQIEEGDSCMQFSCPSCPYICPVTKKVSSRIYPKLKDLEEVLGGPSVWDNAQVR
ncbi:DNA-directed RNA polymerase subunit, partial [Trichostrongylus colubriformis]